MLYFATASTEPVRSTMRNGGLGQIVTPAAGNRLVAGVRWIADNSVFGNKYPGDSAFLAWLAARSHAARDCAFVVAPDVVCDATATLARSVPLLAPIRALGFPVAYVAQNGAEPLSLPWDQFDALFIGGDDAFKLGFDAHVLARMAKRLGKWVHMGRVNSRKRLAYADSIGCDSCDGTYIAFGPTKNLARMIRWLGEINQEGQSREAKI